MDIETNLGIILKDQGDADGAISKLEKVLMCSYAKRTYWVILFDELFSINIDVYIHVYFRKCGGSSQYIG